MHQSIAFRQLGWSAPLFSNNWFVVNVPVWRSLLADLKGKPGLRFLEIGSY
jgi:hypothetical protein